MGKEGEIMKKVIIKCDICKRELDREKEPNYYDIYYKNMPGWATQIGEFSWMQRPCYQICENCSKPLIKNIKI